MSESIEKQRKRRLTNLLRVVERHVGQRGKSVRHPNGVKIAWDMNYWVDKTECKTVGCALGNYLKAGHGGHKFRFDNDGDPIIVVNPGWALSFYEAAAYHFHISENESDSIFSPCRYEPQPVPPIVVARRIKAMIRKYDEGMGDLQ